jgi:cystathionine beta-lyase
MEHILDGWIVGRWDSLMSDLEHFIVHKLKLAVLDGAQFGENGAGFLRLNLGTQRSRVEKAMERIAQAARQHPG